MLAENKSEISVAMMSLVQSMIMNSFSVIFYMIKPFLYNSCAKTRKELAQHIICTKMRDICYNAAAKLERFSQLLSHIRNDEKISVVTLGEFCQCFTSIQLPLVEFESTKMHPYIVQISENLINEIMNNRPGKVVTFLGSDGKEYNYRLETVDRSETGKEYETLLTSQML